MRGVHFLIHDHGLVYGWRLRRRRGRRGGWQWLWPVWLLLQVGSRAGACWWAAAAVGRGGATALLLGGVSVVPRGVVFGSRRFALAGPTGVGPRENGATSVFLRGGSRVRIHLHRQSRVQADERRCQPPQGVYQTDHGPLQGHVVGCGRGSLSRHAVEGTRG